MKIVRKRLSPNEVIPRGTRYNATCNCIQVVAPDGTTWTDTPTSSDPRHGDAFRAPARTGTDIKCSAAANMSATLKKNLDDIILAVNVGAIGTSMMVDLAFLTTGVGFFADLALIIAEGLVALGLTAIEAAFTDSVYETLTCIFYCNIGANGQVSSAELTAIQGAVSSDIGGLVSTVFNLYMGFWGEVGLSNAGSKGTATADCDDCFCAPWHYQWLGAQVFNGFSYNAVRGLSGGALGTTPPGTHGLSTSDGNACYTNIFESSRASTEFNISGTCHVLSIGIKLSQANHLGCDHVECAINPYGGGAFLPGYIYTGSWTTAEIVSSVDYTSETGMWLSYATQSGDTALTVTQIDVTGTGTRPAFTGGAFI